MLDIRWPIGAMFALLGLLLGGYGLMSGSEIYRASLGYNLNLIWGGVMLFFGLAMLGWMRLAPQVAPAVPAAEETPVPVSKS